MLTYFESLGFDIADYPVAYQNYVSEISLPVYAQLTDDEVDFVTDSFIHSYNEVMG
jgi:dTDP-4-amino-4,6-dideoxygalactose transaminase